MSSAKVAKPLREPSQIFAWYPTIAAVLVIPNTRCSRGHQSLPDARDRCALRGLGSAAAHTPSIILPQDTTLCFNRPKQGGTMRIRRLDHVLLAMPAGRETDARNFYSGILGIPEAKKPAELA